MRNILITLVLSRFFSFPAYAVTGDGPHAKIPGEYSDSVVAILLRYGDVTVRQGVGFFVGPPGELVTTSKVLNVKFPGSVAILTLVQNGHSLIELGAWSKDKGLASFFDDLVGLFQDSVVRVDGAGGLSAEVLAR